MNPVSNFFTGLSVTALKTVNNLKQILMKKIGIIILFTAIILQGFSQEVMSKEKQEDNKAVSSSESKDKTKVIIGEDLFRIEEGDGALNIRVGNRGLSILESLENGPRVSFEKFDEGDDILYQDEDYDPERIRSRNRNRFKGHWSGFEFGFNNYLTSDRSLVLPSDIEYMTLHSGKSHNFNFNISQQSIGLTRRIGIVTGLGFNWNNYRFDGNNNIVKGANGIIEELPQADALDKSKLSTLYLTVPMLLELQIPADNHQINLAAGFIGAIKLASHTKMVFQDKDKVKSHGDFSLNLLRYGPTARVGYQSFQIYATYYMTPLFKNGKGPGGYDLYPFEVGFAFTFND